MMMSEHMTTELLRRIFPGDSDIAAKLRKIDWTATELGAPDTWSGSLRTAVLMCLASVQPMQIAWGKQTVIYNDAWAGFLGLEPQVSVAARSGTEVERVMREGEPLTLSGITYIPIFGDAGVDGVVCTVADIDHAKQALNASVGHELRTPLTLLLNPAEDLLARDLDDDLRQPVELIHRNALRLQKLVDSLLDVSRLEAGHEQLTFHPTQLTEVTKEIANAFRPVVERAGLRLEFETGALEDRVYVDARAWQTIVLHLVLNAFKHTFEGAIRITLRRDGDSVRLDVQDTGVGMSTDEARHAFERFHRIANQRARSYDGAGIGLTLARELVTRHQGAIGVVSELGRGATFTVTVPLGHAHLPVDRVHHNESEVRTLGIASFVAEAASWLSTGEQHVGSADGHRPRIVVADSSVDMRAYLVHLLEHEYIVDTAADGQQALELTRTNSPDLVLTDVVLPEIDGPGLVREIRANPTTSAIPVVMLSTRTGEDVRIDALQAGASDYVVLPFSGRELRARVRTQIELAAARAKAGDERANARAKDDFLSLFGHELRNPLSALFTMLQVVARLHPGPEVALMDRAVRHLTRLVDDLLDVSRLNRGKIALHPARVELAKVVDDAMQQVAKQLEERSTRVFVRVPRTGLEIECDPERIAQVLANVLDNASKFSESGSQVSVEASRVDNRARIVIRDQGAGIEPQRLAHVFEPFQDRNGTTHGLGLGLAITRNLIELHGGRVELNSVVGQGTECVIELPMEATTTRAPAPIEKKKTARKRVLLVEDNHDTAVALQRALETLGYQVALAHNGPVALTVARSFQPDVALLDIGLPVMDGWELARRLRELKVPARELHFVAVTARDQDTDKQRSADAGFAEHLVKPIDLVKLERVVESLPD